MKSIIFNTEMVKAILDGRKTVTRRVIKLYRITPRIYKMDMPYEIGDTIYVRETFYPSYDEEGMIEWYYYKANYTTEHPDEMRWKPSIHMPKEAARIFLKVTDVKSKRLQDISVKQCEKEGINVENMYYRFDAVDEFSELWDSTIKKEELDQYGWGANPRVWVIDFEKAEERSNK